MAFFASTSYLSFQLTRIYGTSPFLAGLAYAVAYMVYLVATVLSGKYSTRTKTVRLPLIVALGSFTLYHALMAGMELNTSALAWGYSVFLGIGLGIALNVVVVAAQPSTSVELIAIGTGAIISVCAFGATVGLAIFNNIFNSTIWAHLGPNIAAAAYRIDPKLPRASLGKTDCCTLQLKYCCSRKHSGRQSSYDSERADCIEGGFPNRFPLCMDHGSLLCSSGNHW